MLSVHRRSQELAVVSTFNGSYLFHPSVAYLIPTTSCQRYCPSLPTVLTLLSQLSQLQPELFTGKIFLTTHLHSMSVLILVDLSMIPQSFYIESGLIVGPPILYLLGIFTSYLLDLNFLVWSTFSPFHLTPQYKKKRVNLSVCLSTICLSASLSVIYLSIYLPETELFLTLLIFQECKYFSHS